MGFGKVRTYGVWLLQQQMSTLPNGLWACTTNSSDCCSGACSQLLAPVWCAQVKVFERGAGEEVRFDLYSSTCCSLPKLSRQPQGCAFALFSNQPNHLDLRLVNMDIWYVLYRSR
jgi:hypothetical protein